MNENIDELNKQNELVESLADELIDKKKDISILQEKVGDMSLKKQLLLSLYFHVNLF